MTRPLCFVLMPFGRKPDGAGGIVEFDQVYAQLIRPAIEAAELEALRADEEQGGGFIHKPMFERLLLCEYAVADLTTANANVFYELGVRHAIRPWSTVLIFAEGGRLPFDVAAMRALPYRIGPAGFPADPESAREQLVQRLVEARKGSPDSPIYQLLDSIPPPQIDRAKTDVFREQVRYSAELKERLAQARGEGVDALRAIQSELAPIELAESGVVVDLFLSYRAVSAWDDMIALLESMSEPLANTTMVQEQLAFALNRAGRGEQAERILTELIAQRGTSSETYGLLGRVYKDRWAAARETDPLLARGYLGQAIDAYLRGFETDWRDAYPGVNALSLMEINDPMDPRREKLLPVVAYAVDRRIARGEPDYWDRATLLELAVIAKDEKAAPGALAAALASVREGWEPESTANNLGLIRAAREQRGEELSWAADVENALRRRAAR